MGIVPNTHGFLQNTPGPVDEADALSIIGTIQGIQPVVTTALVNVAAKKTDLEALLPGTVGAGVVDTLMAAALTALSTIFNVRYKAHYASYCVVDG